MAKRKGENGMGDYSTIFVAEPITAYKAWYVNPTNFRLRSTWIQTHYWDAGKSYKANCLVDVGGAKEPHKSPIKECSCGFYTLKVLNSQRFYNATTIDSYYLAYGEAEIWGKVIEHEEGYRSQYCRMKRIVWFPPWAIVLPEYEEWYVRSDG